MHQKKSISRRPQHHIDCCDDTSALSYYMCEVDAHKNSTGKWIDSTAQEVAAGQFLLGWRAPVASLWKYEGGKCVMSPDFEPRSDKKLHRGPHDRLSESEYPQEDEETMMILNDRLKSSSQGIPRGTSYSFNFNSEDGLMECDKSSCFDSPTNSPCLCSSTDNSQLLEDESDQVVSCRHYYKFTDESLSKFINFYELDLYLRNKNSHSLIPSFSREGFNYSTERPHSDFHLS